MRVSLATFFVGLLLLVVGLQGQMTPEPELFSIEAAVLPDRAMPGTYVCEATIVNLETEEVLAAPRVRFTAGTDAQIHSATPSGLEIKATIAISEEGDRALFSSEISQGDRLLHSQAFAIQM